MNASASSGGGTAPNGPAGPQASRRRHSTSKRPLDGSGFKRATSARAGGHHRCSRPGPNAPARRRAAMGRRQCAWSQYRPAPSHPSVFPPVWACDARTASQNSLPEQPPRTASRSTMVRPGLHLPPSFLAWLAPFLAARVPAPAMPPLGDPPAWSLMARSNCFAFSVPFPCEAPCFGLWLEDGPDEPWIDDTIGNTLRARGQAGRVCQANSRLQGGPGHIVSHLLAILLDVPARERGVRHVEASG